MSEALHAEACALMHAINLAEAHGTCRVIFEIDCFGLVSAISTTVLDQSNLGAIFRETRFLLHIGFIEWSIVHCPRTCTIPAHELASLGFFFF